MRRARQQLAEMPAGWRARARRRAGRARRRGTRRCVSRQSASALVSVAARDAVGARGAQLVVHQRDQRADHHAGARQHRRGQLVGQRLARAGRHHRERRAAGQHALDHLRLDPAKIVEPEQFAQARARRARDPERAMRPSPSPAPWHGGPREGNAAAVDSSRLRRDCGGGKAASNAPALPLPARHGDDP